MDSRSVEELDEARQDFLSKLPPNYQGMACNYFLSPPRLGGPWTPETVLIWVKDEIWQRLQSAASYRQASEDGERSYQNLFGLWAAMRDDPEGALTLAEWAIAYVAMPDNQRQARKARKQYIWAAEAMRGKPATLKQMDYLQKLGYKAEVVDRRHASDLINRLTRR